MSLSATGIKLRSHWKDKHQGQPGLLMTSAVEVLYIMSPITHMLSLYYHIIFYNFHYLTIYLYAHGDLGTPEVTSFFPNVVMHVRLKHLAI